MKKIAFIASAIVVLGLLVAPTRGGTESDNDLTKRIYEVLADCQKIKPGMTRAELTKFFKADTGGVAWDESTPLSFQPHQRFDYRRCNLIQVEVDFSPSNFKDARPTDIIIKISKPCLDDSPRN